MDDNRVLMIPYPYFCDKENMEYLNEESGIPWTVESLNRFINYRHRSMILDEINWFDDIDKFKKEYEFETFV